MNTEEEIMRKAKRILNFLEDIDDLTDIRFNLKQIHELTDIKENKIQYWTDKGCIKKLNKNKKRYRYSPKEVKKVLIIDWLSGKEQEDFYKLDAASRMAEKIVNINDKETAILVLSSSVWIFKSNLDQISKKLIETNLTEDLMEILTHS